MKKLLALALTALLILPAAASAQGRLPRPLGQLDPEFGNGGQLLLQRGTAAEGVDAALLEDGHVLVAERTRMLALLPSGKVDPGFGEAGVAALLTPPGASSAKIVAIAVDTQGRIVVVGSCTFPAAEVSSRQGILAERFAADGRIDRSFGEGDGFTVTRFDDPAHTRPRAIASVVAARLDGADRILVSGESPGGQITYKGFPYGADEPFVARLSAGGGEDSSFGEGGVVSMPRTTHVGAPILDSAGGVYISTSQALFHLRADGSLDPSFGEGGVRLHVQFAYELAAVDAFDRPLFYGQLATHGVSNRVLIKRLEPDGALDRSFGQNGAVTLRLPRLVSVELGLDEGGGVLVAATQKRRPRSGHRKMLPPRAMITRLRQSDGLDTPFGQAGLLRIPFEHSERARIDGLDVVGSEVLLSGTWCDPGPCGRAFIRAELRSP
jgi:uncharacterized delta-60 repeat protein